MNQTHLYLNTRMLVCRDRSWICINFDPWKAPWCEFRYHLDSVRTNSVTLLPSHLSTPLRLGVYFFEQTKLPPEAILNSVGRGVIEILQLTQPTILLTLFRSVDSISKSTLKEPKRYYVYISCRAIKIYSIKKKAHSASVERINRSSTPRLGWNRR